MEHPVGEKSLRRAPSVYSAASAWYSAPIYTASVGDALNRVRGCNNEATLLGWQYVCSFRLIEQGIIFFCFFAKEQGVGRVLLLISPYPPELMMHAPH
jgi:hypothetical protein